MQRDLQIIGDRIEFMGYHVGTLSDIVPTSIRNKLIDLLEGTKPTHPYYTGKVR